MRPVHFSTLHRWQKSGLTFMIFSTGAVIKELREKYHLTQVELAEKLNLSDKTISKWEKA